MFTCLSGIERGTTCKKEESSQPMVLVIIYLIQNCKQLKLVHCPILYSFCTDFFFICSGLQTLLGPNRQFLLVDWATTMHPDVITLARGINEKDKDRDHRDTRGG